ncbi:zinc finger, CCHC-type containing protein [Tanacetum coccineum]
MDATAMKHMASNFAKLDKFEGVNFRRWQKKMHFLLSSMSVVYVPTTSILEDGGDNPTVEQVKKRAKWDNHDYVCRGLILNVIEQYNKLLGILERFTQHKINMDEAIKVSCVIDNLPLSWKDFKHTLKNLKEELTLVELGNHLRIEKSLRVQDNDKPKDNNVASSSVVNMVEHNNSCRYNDNKGKRKHHDNTRADPNKKVIPTCWKCGKTGHIKRDCKGVNVGNKANGSSTKGSVDGSFNSLKGQNMFNKSLQVYYVTYVSETYFVQDDDVAWWVDLGSIVHVSLDKFKVFKTELELQQGSLIKRFRTDRGGEYMDTMYFQSVGIIHETTAPYTPQQNGISERKNWVLKAIGNSMLSYLGLSQGFWGEAILTACYLLNRIPNKRNKITPYELWTKRKPNLNYLRVWGCRAVAFRFSSVPRPSQRSLLNGTEDIGGSVVPEKADPKIFDEAIKSQDVDGTIEKFKARLVILGFRQKSGIDYFDSYAPVARITTIRLLIAMASIHNLIIHQMDMKKDFLNGKLDEKVFMNQPQGFIMPRNKTKVDLTKEFLSSRFSMKDMGEADVILGIRIKYESNGIAISDLIILRRVIGCLMYAMTCTRPDIAFVVGKLSRLIYTSYPSVLKGYTYASWISNTEDNSSTSGWVFLLGGGAISWASKKQTRITGSTMESKFIALTAAGKEVEWLKNMLLEIPLLVKPIAHISIRCDSSVTLPKAYSQMYNEKSRDLGVRHNMIRELITNGVVSIEFVRSRQNLPDHLMKGLARDLVLESTEGMGLKSN